MPTRGLAITMLSTDAKQSPTPLTMPHTGIRVYNTLSRTKEPFEPLTPGKVGIYLCGPTVYRPSHIGHMVGPVIFDAIKRYLEYCGYDVTFVVNITDIDDKLIAESEARGITITELAREMEEDYLQNIRALGIDTVDHFPRATEHIEAIVRFIQNLVDKGFAYVAQAGGDVYFDVSKDAQYGKLSGRSVEHMQGEGGEMVQRKRHAADFALWKGAKPGEPSWPSTWGPGRPGWHIECSVMSSEYLGETFDIHGGGLDLVFPHHENEIAQSRCGHGKPQAKYWMHNGLMQAADEIGKVGGRETRAEDEGDQEAQEAGKMGKSKGASAFSELLKRYPAETIRAFLLSTQYRRPIYFSDAEIEKVGTSLETFYRFFKRYERVTGESFYAIEPPRRRDAAPVLDGDHPVGQETDALRSKFLGAMDDDFNTAAARGALFDLVRTLNRFVDSEKLDSGRAPPADKLAVLNYGATVLRELSAILGLFREPITETKGADQEIVGHLVALLIEIRAEARKKKDFATADQVRNRLAELGITLEDRADGTDWSR